MAIQVESHVAADARIHYHTADGATSWRFKSNRTLRRMHVFTTTPPTDLHTARLRGFLAPEDELDSTVVITDHLTGLPLSVVHMAPLEAEDGSIVMLPRDPVPP